MSGSNDMGYLMMLLIGAGIVLLDGQMIMRQSPGYLGTADQDPRKAQQTAKMVVFFFHLVMLGVVLLVVSGLHPDPTVPTLLRRLGFLLILTAGGHAITMVILSRLRDQQTATELADAGVKGPTSPPQDSGRASATARTRWPTTRRAR